MHTLVAQVSKSMHPAAKMGTPGVQKSLINILFQGEKILDINII